MVSVYRETLVRWNFIHLHIYEFREHEMGNESQKGWWKVEYVNEILDGGQIGDKIERYFEVKQQVNRLEQELQHLRSDIIAFCERQEVSELVQSGYRVKLVQQERKDYDDRKMYEALPDPDVWRMLSRVDAGKVASLIKLNVISEESIRDAFTVKTTTLLNVTKL